MNVDIIKTYIYTGISGFVVCRHFSIYNTTCTPVTSSMPYCNITNTNNPRSVHRSYIEAESSLEYQRTVFYNNLDLVVYRILHDYFILIHPEGDLLLQN